MNGAEADQRWAAIMPGAANRDLWGESSRTVIIIAGTRNTVDPATHINAPAAI
jgi:hypothetical protein